MDKTNPAAELVGRQRIGTNLTLETHPLQIVQAQALVMLQRVLAALHLLKNDIFIPLEQTFVSSIQIRIARHPFRARVSARVIRCDGRVSRQCLNVIMAARNDHARDNIRQVQQLLCLDCQFHTFRITQIQRPDGDVTFDGVLRVGASKVGIMQNDTGAKAISCGPCPRKVDLVFDQIVFE